MLKELDKASTMIMTHTLDTDTYKLNVCVEVYLLTPQTSVSLSETDVCLKCLSTSHLVCVLLMTQGSTGSVKFVTILTYMFSIYKL